MNRVVITGQGSINSLGQNVPETLTAMANAQLGISPLQFEDVDRLSVQIGGQIKDFEPLEHFSRQKLPLYDRFTQFALIAAREAISQSGLTFNDAKALRSGVILGNSGGGMNTLDDNYRSVYQDGKNRVHPFVVPKLMGNAASSHVAIENGIMGPCFSLSSACASSNHAIGIAFQMLRSGSADIMITGGSESMLCFGGIKAWEGLRVMSKTGCRPFCASRDGMVQGEGAAIFVLETYEHARKRNANIVAEICGFSMCCDADDIVSPSPVGAARAISGALTDAQLAPSDIGYVNAHGTGTKANDVAECLALTSVFGPAASDLLISSTKSMHGHAIGGTGAIELLAAIMALTEGVIAPTIGFETTDPDCPFDVVPNEARRKKVDAVLSNAFAFGGLNAVLALRAI